MIDIMQIKQAVRTGEITVYEEYGRLYMENRYGERITLYPKSSPERSHETEHKQTDAQALKTGLRITLSGRWLL